MVTGDHRSSAGNVSHRHDIICLLSHDGSTVDHCYGHVAARTFCVFVCVCVCGRDDDAGEWDALISQQR